MKRILLLICCFMSFGVYASAIEFVVASSAGGPDDTVTRKLVEKLESQTKLKFVVVNKPGAAHQIGYNYVNSRNAPTLIVSTPTILTNDVINSINPLFYLGDFTSVLFVNRQSGIKNMDDLIELSKKREIIFGTGGFGTYSHKAMSELCEKTLRCLPVPYKGGGEATFALMNGTIDAYAFISYGAKALEQNEKLIPIDRIKFKNEKNWLILFGKNINESDSNLIKETLKSLGDDFYNNLGVMYQYKDVRQINLK
jgi:tripartite-type tricarboxylate transporter receptor subunit TctC